MSALEAALTLSAVVAVSVPAVRMQIRRARRHESQRNRIIRESYERDGSIAANDPRLPAGIDAALDDYAAFDPDLAPIFVPGLDRLRQAVRDEQQNGDQR